LLWRFRVVGSVEKARTMVFIVTYFYQLIVVWNYRSESRNAFKVGFLTNKPLLIAVTISIFSTLVVTLCPRYSLFFRQLHLIWKRLEEYESGK